MKIIPERKFYCPACDEEMEKFVPIVYSGKDVQDYTCKQPDCKFHIYVQIKEKGE